MKKILFVVFCLLISNNCFADKLSSRLQLIDSVWEQVEANSDQAQQHLAFPRLRDEATTLANEFPHRAEPIILQACIILTHARIQGPFDALSSVHIARDLLLKAMAIDPNASNGSALVTMGVLYYKVPGWPLAFGDKDKAERMLTRALQINPQGIDSNYFYGEFLILQDKPEFAVKYLKKAINAPVHPGLARTTLELRTKAQLALREIQALKVSSKTDASVSSLQSFRANN